jgi:hypothetical protein
MSAVIEIRKTDDGAILARRVDGKPLTPEDREEAKRMAATRPTGLTVDEIIDIDAGKISAVLIDCDFGPFWFAFADDFKPGDDIPTFFASELPHLRQMTPDELRRRYAEKRALGGGWIRNRIEH